MSHSHRLLAVFAVLVAGFLPNLASAGVIRSAVDVVRAPNRASGSLGGLIDQSGLSVGYIDGATDFDAYIAQSPTHEAYAPSNEYFNGWSFNGSVPIDFDLGAPFQIRQLAFWNAPMIGYIPILDFEVYTANSVDFLDAMLVGSFTAVHDGGPRGQELPYTTGAQVFDLLDTDARYLRIRVLTAATGGGRVIDHRRNRLFTYGLSEVAFDTGPVSSEVPEPGSLSLMVLGVAALIGVRRRSD